MTKSSLRVFRHILVATAMFAAISGSTIAPRAETSEDRPIKLVVVVPSMIYRTGAAALVSVESRDAANKATPAITNLAVDVTLRTPSGRVEHQKTEIAKGQSSVKLALALPEAGFSDVHAATPTLISGQNVVNVFAPSEGHASPSREREPASETKPPRPGPATSPAAEMRRETSKESAEFSKPTLRHRKFQMKAMGEPKPLAKSFTTGPSVTYLKEAPAPAAGGLAASAETLRSAGIKIALRLTPDRKLLASDIDTATIRAFLTGSAPIFSREVKIYLWCSADETPTPNPITIPAGQNEGTATLKAMHSGLIRIGARYADPDADFDPASGELQVTFAPPITAIQVVPSPASISLADTSQLEVRLVDPRNVMVKSDEARTIVFALSQGAGEIVPLSLSIAKGAAQGIATFRPQEPGTVKLSASTPELNTESVQLNVSWPGLLIVCSIAGALLGGLIAAIARKKPEWLRLPIGFVAGALLYWGVVSTGVAGESVTISVLNPILALVVAAVGGYLGTQVFVFIAKRLGFSVAND